MTRLVDFLRRMVKRLIWLAIFLMVVIGCVLALYRWRADLREQFSAEDFAPATGHFIKTSDGTLFVQELGPATGVAVLLVHGTGAWSETWRHTMQALAGTNFHVIAIDLPPFGFSQRSAAMDYSKAAQGKRIVNILDALNIKRAILVGHSFGAGPTVEAAMQIPDRVIKLVIVDGALNVHAKSDAAASAQLPGLVKFGLHSVPIRNAVVATFITNPSFTKTLLQKFIDDPRGASEEYVNIYQRPLIIKGATESVGAWLPELLDTTHPARSEDASQYQTLKMPVTLIWGKRDTITPLIQGQQLQAIISQSELVVMDDVGHIPQIENNTEFNTALIAALVPSNSSNAKSIK